MAPPSRQDGGGTRAASLACVVCVAVQVFALARMRWSSFYCQLSVSARKIKHFLSRLGRYPGRPLFLFAQRDTTTSTRRACSSTRLRHNCSPGPYRLASWDCRRLKLCDDSSTCSSILGDGPVDVRLAYLWNAILLDNIVHGFQLYPVSLTTDSYTVGSLVNLKHHRGRIVTCRITS